LKSNNLTPLVALESATAHYGNQQVLQAIDLRLHRGERVVVLGKSGAGKSTLLSLLHTKLVENHETLSWIPQQHGLVDNLSVFHNILMGQIDQRSRWHNLLNLFWPQTQAKNKISVLLASLELDGQLFTPVAQLSGGQQQRVAIGRALYRQAAVLLADEPIANLDKPLASRILNILSKRFNGFVISLHDTDLALAYADRIVGIKAGRILIDQPRNRLTAADLEPLYEDESRL
jgi:phosphonate transport system ATP-binding protein